MKHRLTCGVCALPKQKICSATQNRFSAWPATGKLIFFVLTFEFYTRFLILFSRIVPKLHKCNWKVCMNIVFCLKKKTFYQQPKLFLLNSQGHQVKLYSAISPPKVEKSKHPTFNCWCVGWFVVVLFSYLYSYVFCFGLFWFDCVTGVSLFLNSFVCVYACVCVWFCFCNTPNAIEIVFYWFWLCLCLCKTLGVWGLLLKQDSSSGWLNQCYTISMYFCYDCYYHSHYCML